MRRLLLALIFLLPTLASAQVVNTLPFQLQNGTTADASQVMANFNQIVNNTNANAATNGVNSDITALVGLTTPIAPSGGGTNQFVGGTSSGTNSYVVATTVPANFTLTKGNTVTFQVGTTNTGPSTLAAASQTATNIYRRTSLGAIPMAGGELIAGNVVSVIYDGTEFQLVSDSVQLIGDMRDFGGSSPPPGYFIEDGSCQSRTTYAALFSVIGTAFDPTGSTCDTAHFALPDTRGRMTAGVDAGIGRITVAGSECAATLGLGCGSQTETLTQPQLPAVAPTFVGTPANWQVFGNGGVVNTFPVLTFGSIGFTTGTYGLTSAFAQGTPAGTISNLGSGLPHPILGPIQVVTKIIKF